MEMSVIDKKGSWFINTAMFPAVFAPENLPDVPAVAPVRFEPGLPTKVLVAEESDLAAWLSYQTMIVPCPDPMNSDEPMPQVIVPVENVVVPTNEVTGQPDASAAPGIQGSAAEGPALTAENALAPANTTKPKK